MAKAKKETLKKGGIMEKSKPKKAPKKEFHCPYCSQELTKVQLYDEYFCETCVRYVHRHLLGLAQKTRVSIVCPTCESEPEYEHDYNKHYCHNCKKYLSIDEIEKRRSRWSPRRPRRRPRRISISRPRRSPRQRVTFAGSAMGSYSSFTSTSGGTVQNAVNMFDHRVRYYVELRPKTS